MGMRVAQEQERCAMMADEVAKECESMAARRDYPKAHWTRAAAACREVAKRIRGEMQYITRAALMEKLFGTGSKIELPCGEPPHDEPHQVEAKPRATCWRCEGTGKYWGYDPAQKANADLPCYCVEAREP
jgi:hypothetical protein